MNNQRNEKQKKDRQTRPTHTHAPSATGGQTGRPGEPKQDPRSLHPSLHPSLTAPLPSRLTHHSAPSVTHPPTRAQRPALTVTPRPATGRHRCRYRHRYRCPDREIYRELPLGSVAPTAVLVHTRRVVGFARSRESVTVWVLVGGSGPDPRSVFAVQLPVGVAVQLYIQITVQLSTLRPTPTPAALDGKYGPTRYSCTIPKSVIV